MKIKDVIEIVRHSDKDERKFSRLIGELNCMKNGMTPKVRGVFSELLQMRGKIMDAHFDTLEHLEKLKDKEGN